MWVKRLVLRNIGPHKSLDLTFKNGLIGIFGPNGSGKTWILNSIYAGLTNDFGRFADVKAKCFTDGTSGQGSSIEVEAVHNEYEFTVKRSLPSKSSLIIKGVKGEINDTNKIATRISEMLGIDISMLDLFVFLQQDRIFGFLAQTDSERKRAFQKLCRTDNCEDIAESIAKFLNVHGNASEVVDNSDQLEADRAAAAKEVSEAREKLRAAKAKLLPEEERAKLAYTVESYHRRIELNSQIKVMQRELKELRAGVETNRKEFETAKASAKAAKAKVLDPDQMRGKLELIQAATNWENHTAKLTNLGLLLARATDEHNALLEQAPVTPKALVNFDLEKVTKELDTARAARIEANRIVEACSGVADDAAVCPTCNQSLSDHKKRKTEAAKKLKELKETIQALTDLIAANTEHERKCSEHRRKLARATDNLELRREEFETVNAIKVPEVDAAKVLAAREAISKNKKRTQALVDANNWLSTITSTLKVAQSRRNDKKVALVKAIEERDAITTTKEEADQALATRKKQKAIRTLITEVKAKLSVHKQSVATYTAAIDQLQAKIEAAKANVEMSDILRRVRGVFHYQGLPLIVSKHNLIKMEKTINANLRMLGNPFWISARDDLTFTVHKPGVPPESSMRLSVGQKVILAVAFWLSIVPLIGMLALDEPTANLDEERRGYLAHALAALGNQVRDSRQVIMVTHADNLRSSFTQVIDLNEKARYVSKQSVTPAK